MFVPKRLEIDLALTVGEIDPTNTPGGAHSAVDTSKVVITKPTKGKK